MKRWLKRIIFLILIFIFISFTLSTADSTAKKQQMINKEISYVALGDSIANGILSIDFKIKSYSDYFHEYIQSYYGSKTKIKYENFAKEGDRTNELLLKLKSDNKIREAVKEADIITISIGGNNILQSTEIPGFRNIDKKVAEEGLKDFKEQWIEIIKNILEINIKKDVKIIVTTVYNPFNSVYTKGYSKDVSLHKEIDSYLARDDGQGINQIIYSNTNLGYKVADVYKSFDSYSDTKMNEITLFYPKPYLSVFRNPHPNETGQQIIFKLHKSVFESFFK